MSQFFLPRPWWVNLSILVPILTFYALRKRKPSLGNMELSVTALFGITFAFVEAAVVIYLRAITGFLLGSESSEVASLSSTLYHVAQIVNNFPTSLLKVELLREAATIIMLGCVALLTVRDLRARWAIFLWVFAIWDLCYYLFLRLTVGWPLSLTTNDILFLIPTPWISQIWFPLLVSIITLVAVILIKENPERAKKKPPLAKSTNSLET